MQKSTDPLVHEIREAHANDLFKPGNISIILWDNNASLGSEKYYSTFRSTARRMHDKEQVSFYTSKSESWFQINMENAFGIKGKDLPLVLVLH